MANYHEYDDLFASYERRSNASKSNTDAVSTTGTKKSSGYTSSSSYSKKTDSAISGSFKSIKDKAHHFEKKVRNKTPEKSQKKYYGTVTPDTTAKRRVKKSAAEDDSATVKFHYNSTVHRNEMNADEKLDYVKSTKDDYRRKYERMSAERTKAKRIKKPTEKIKKEKAPKSASFKKTLIFLICVIAASCLFTFVSISCVNDVLAINRNSEKTVTLTIDKQVDTKTVIRMLKKNNLIKNELFCRLFASFKGYSDNYETGVFYLKEDMGLEGMILALKATNQTEETITITFPEGYSVIDIAKKLEANEVCDAKNFIDTLENYNFEYDFLPGNLKADKRKYQYMEGYLFPSTYDFYIGESPSSVIKKMLNAFEENIYTDEFKTKSQELGMNTDEIITLASIIQREAANSEQMKQIANVLNNRLKNSSTFPRLECDSTTDFLSKDVKEYLDFYPDKGTIDYYALYYNTYNNSFEGLPAGAICNPGLDAVQAVLDMESSPYYYFFHDKERKIHLATTLYEFEYMKKQYGVNES